MRLLFLAVMLSVVIGLATASAVSAAQPDFHPIQTIQIGTEVLKVGWSPLHGRKEIRVLDSEGHDHFPRDMTVDVTDGIAIESDGQTIIVIQGGGILLGDWFTWNGSSYHHVRRDWADVVVAASQVTCHQPAAWQRLLNSFATTRFQEALRRCQTLLDHQDGGPTAILESTQAVHRGWWSWEFPLPGGRRVGIAWTESGWGKAWLITN